MKKNRDISANPSALRSLAEQQLKKHKAGSAIPRTEEETQKLLHELQVHQIELEMQNEEMRRAREETDVALERYTELYDFAPVGYFTLDKDGIISSVNLTGASLLGTERSRLINRPLDLFITVEDRPVFNAFLKNVFEGKSKESCEVRLRKKDQSSFVYIEATVLIAEQKCHAVAVDITGRRLLEKEKERLASFPQLDPNPVIEVAASGKIFFHNTAALETLRTLGLQEDVRLFLPEDMSEILSDLKQERDSKCYREVKIKDSIFGENIYLSLEFNVGRIYAIDITDRKMTEEALHTSSERYRSYIEVTGELGWTTNADGEVVEDMPSWRTYTGQTYEEIRGQGWSKALHPDDVEHTLKIWRKAVLEKNKYEVEYRIRRHDGIYRYFMTRGTPVLKEDESIQEWVGTCIDITERKSSEEQISRLNMELKRKVSELEAANKDWEMFSHAVSHELRSPLFLIDGFSRIVLKKNADKVDVKGREMLTTIMKTVKQMVQLLDDLFVFSLARAKEIKADTVNMEEIAKHAFNELKPGIGNRNIQLEMKSLPSCHGDSSLLRQVFVNLFTNAIKFTESKDIALIEVGSIEKGDDIAFYVKDNGVGFDMQYKDKLFNIFQRLHSSRDFMGTGAGLAIVRRIIEKHGGKVWAESKLGEGATFYFTLPEINASEKLSEGLDKPYSKSNH